MFKQKLFPGRAEQDFIIHHFYPKKLNIYRQREKSPLINIKIANPPTETRFIPKITVIFLFSSATVHF